jgi:quercetin dioxygenase-like cupin family protein
VVSGRGWAQREGGPAEEIYPGDIVRFAPGEKHWHGASAEAQDGKAVDRMEQVSDEQDLAGPGLSR